VLIGRWLAEGRSTDFTNHDEANPKTAERTLLRGRAVRLRFLHMDPTQINEMFRAMSRQRSGSADFQKAVWREIRHRRALGESSRSLAEVWLPTLRGIYAPTAMASLFAAALVAWAVGTSWKVPEGQRDKITAQNLNLGVFGPNANGLAYDLLVVKR
jgi:hypothetical protein